MTEILSSASSSSSSSKTAELDAPLHAIGFEIDVVSSDEVNGTLEVTNTCCQPFKVLHVFTAHVASGFRRIAGIQLSINHHRSARLGDRVFARATPIHVGKTIQVWEVHLWKINPGSSPEKRELLASSKVTLLSNMPVPKENKDAGDALRKYAKL
ncbi:uncharacterized protein A4U43_C03F14980 [Asparagus officinalis]|uniref:Thioesterase domain-containing protein n=1 Tax=Asparagus officinalis TaxID=4686 RepID=A0A5P1FA41_ASPOF|nr:1,4-dihydroxy-2-naphthoyl-CoA thioesterase 1-like [Asparagus officinalis]ONK75256.1 uncharacterized protein A4U43_C03F14980 [Asparagus officinalis]